MIADGAWIATAVFMDARNECGHDKVGEEDAFEGLRS